MYTASTPGLMITHLDAMESNHLFTKLGILVSAAAYGNITQPAVPLSNPCVMSTFLNYIVLFSLWD